MSQRVEKVAVMFADICGSTALYEELGDDMARRLISECIALLSKAISDHKGTLVKTIGDEVMCTFPSAEAAFNAACAMQTAIKNDRTSNDKPMYIRVGFHYGDVIHEAGDVFGDTVNTAARVTSITRAGQIMITPAVGEILPPEFKEKIRHIMRTELKGKQEQIDIYLVIWDKDDLMSTRIMVSPFHKSSNTADELILQYRGQPYKINKECRSLMMGREDVCDIVVSNTMASRQHVRIEWRNGKFVITDQSTNGTFIRLSDGKEVQITREEMILHGKGSISLGSSYAENPVDIVEFSIDPTPVQQGNIK
jgi:class 3 adenylate cyclase